MTPADQTSPSFLAPSLPDLPLTRAITDRAAVRRGPGLLAELVADPATRVLDVAGGRLRVGPGGDGLSLRDPEPADLGRLAVFLGHDADRTAYLAVDRSVDAVVEATPDEAADATDEAGRPTWQPLRAVAAQLTPEAAGLAVQAVAVLNWHATHPRCPRCGEPTLVAHCGYSRVCPQDGSEHWPRTDAAVIMLVEDAAGRVLLGRHLGSPTGRFSTLAGFVEPGESLEAAVRREVHEEVGVQVGAVTYLGSQPWPFPSSIMLGFHAVALTDELYPDGTEIAEARWFGRDTLAQLVADGVVGLAPRLSISRALVEHWYGGRLEDPPPVVPA